MANLAALIAAYDLDAGDIVNVDGGNYRLLRDVLLLAEDGGVRIQGLPIAAPSILDRVNRTDGHEVFDVRGAETVILRDLQITGGYYGLLADDPEVNRSGLTIQNNEFVGNEREAILIDSSYNNVLVTGNLVRDTTFGNATGIKVFGGLNATVTITDNEVFGHTFGIWVDGDNGLIDGNEVYGNSNTGIYARGLQTSLVVCNNIVRNNGTTSNGFGIDANVLVTDNLVFEQGLNNGRGISLEINGIARNNVVRDNYYGVYTNRGTVEENRIFNNSQAGIYVIRRATVTENQVYSNSIGVHLFGGIAQGSTLTNNLLYSNTNQGILINISFGSTSSTNTTVVSQNTIYQPVGDAIRVENNTRNLTIRNNILWVLAGFDLNFTSNSQNFISSDYNILHQSGDPNAHVGFWNNTIQDSLVDWQTASSLDATSIDLDPLFVDIDGADNVLGWDPTGDGFDGGLDDNFYRLKNSPATDSGDSWNGTGVDIEGFSRVDDPGVPNNGTTDYFSGTDVNTVYDGNGLPFVTGTPQNIFSNGSSFNLNLPFAFNYFDSSHTSVRVYVDGYIAVSAPGINGQIGTSLDTSLARLMAPLWDDLNTLGAGDNIYVDTGTPGAVTIRWDATNSADDSDVHFAVTLFDDGTLRYDYGVGNTNLTPEVGISHGSGFYHQTVPGHHQMSTLTNAPSIVFTTAPGVTDIGAYEFRGSSLDTSPPGVLQLFFNVTDGPNGQISQIQVGFTEVLNTLDANSPDNYELRDDGGNGVFGDGGDLIYDLIPHYTAGTTIVFLDVVVPNGGLLPVGKYQITVSGNTSIHDLSGLRLDGDNDGNEGGNLVLGNQSPQLDSIGDKDITSGNLLAFTVTANDPDLPAQNLIFSLGNDAPANASIDPITGAFNWQTTPADGQATYLITIIVTDDGVPGLTASETISVFVNDPPAVLNLTVNDGLAQRSDVNRLDLTFNDDVSATLELNDIVVENLDTVKAIDPADMMLSFDVPTLTATITFPGLADGLLPDEGNYRITVLAAGVNDPEGLFMAGDESNDFHVLQGDVNGDRTTNDLDFYQVWQNLLKPAVDRDLNEDLNGDGSVDSGDLSEVRSNYLVTLSPAPLTASTGSHSLTIDLNTSPAPLNPVASTAAVSESSSPAPKAAEKGSHSLRSDQDTAPAILSPVAPTAAPSESLPPAPKAAGTGFVSETSDQDQPSAIPNSVASTAVISESTAPDRVAMKLVPHEETTRSETTRDGPAQRSRVNRLGLIFYNDLNEEEEQEESAR